MEIVHQGYLLCSIGGISAGGDLSSQNLQKVYAVLSTDQLVCYTENPALQHFSKVNIVSSFNLKHARIADTSDSKHPKSFEVSSTKDHTTAEFVCATNSVKFQWVKQLQVQTCASAPTPDAKSSSARTGDSIMVARPVIRSFLEETPTQQGFSRLTASRNLAAKVLTPVPRISYNTSMLDQSSGLNVHVAESKPSYSTSQVDGTFRNTILKNYNLLNNHFHFNDCRLCCERQRSYR
jgi:hypothetical protein